MPPSCPSAGSRGVNNGHSCHFPTYPHRSALKLVSTLITARSSKLAMRVRFPSAPPPSVTCILAGRLWQHKNHGPGLAWRECGPGKKAFLQRLLVLSDCTTMSFRLAEFEECDATVVEDVRTTTPMCVQLLTSCAPLRSSSVNASAVCGPVAGPNSMVNAIYSSWLVDVALLRCW